MHVICQLFASCIGPGVRGTVGGIVGGVFSLVLFAVIIFVIVILIIKKASRGTNLIFLAA